MDKSKQVAEDRCACRTAIQDIGEESDKSEAQGNNSPDSNNSQEEIDNQIKTDIKK